MEKSLDELMTNDRSGRMEGRRGGGGFFSRGQGQRIGGNRFFERRPRGGDFGGRERGPREFDRRRESFSPGRGLQERKPIYDGKGRAIKIFNLQPDINEQELYNLVAQFGPVESCKISRDPKGRSQENATIVYRDFESADAAKQDLHRIDIEGRTVSVEIRKISELDDEEGGVVVKGWPRELQRRGLFRDTERRREGGRLEIGRRSRDIPW